MTFNDLLDQYDRGNLTRRQLMQGLLVLVVAPTAAAQAQQNDPIRARTINHVHIMVQDLEASKAFYSKVFGARFVFKFNDNIESIVLPGDQGWISLDRAGADPKRRGTLGHYSIGIERFNAAETKAAIMKVMPDLKVETRPTGRSIFVDDPDGIHIQLIDRRDKGDEK